MNHNALIPRRDFLKAAALAGTALALPFPASAEIFSHRPPRGRSFSAADNLEQLEWLEPDGFGGFASGTASGVRTRRYHALLLTATTPPTNRFVLVNGIDAWLETSAGRVSLSPQRFADNPAAVAGGVQIESFTADPWPRWVFKCAGDLRVEFEICAAHEKQITVLRWRLLTPRQGVRLGVRPLLSGRDFHALHHENPVCQLAAATRGEAVAWQPYGSVPGVTAITNGVYTHAPEWRRNFFYAEEHARGQDDTEDLATPGIFNWNLAASDAVCLFTTTPVATAEQNSLPAAKFAAALFAAALFAAEKSRREKFPTRLHRAADAYIVTGRHGKTIIAGYPWFADWGRDTCISLRGLCLASGRVGDAREILLGWADAVSEGMLPNRFPDVGEKPEFNAVDASLWYVVAVHEYLAACRREKIPTPEQSTLFAAIEKILAGYSAGTRYGIRMDADGLIAAGQPGVQLTWMDAKCGDWVVTPRIGKPVEIQALWLNALKLHGAVESKWNEFFARGLAAFQNRFWNAERGCLFDVVDCDHKPGTADAAIRPNQIFAVGGLPFNLLPPDRAARVVATVEEKLMTPFGPRSLAPGEAGYCGHYEGDLRSRDGCYHQGTVWPWLTGAFVEAWVRVHGDSRRTRRDAREKFLNPLLARLDAAGLGHIAEIADADAPFTPRGCPFQAWSVGEALRLDHVVLAETKG